MSKSDVKSVTGWGGLILLILALLCKFLWHWGNWVLILPIIPLVVWLAIVIYDAFLSSE